MRVSVNGVRLFVDVLNPKLVQDSWDWRSQPTLLLVHGGPGSDHLTYRQPNSAFDRLTEFAQVVLVDLRGSGASDPASPETWNLASWGADVVEMCRVLELTKPVLFGESAGGFVVLEALRIAPELFGGAVLSNTSASWSLDRVAAAFERIADAEIAEVARRFWVNPNDAAAGVDYAVRCLPLYTQAKPAFIEPPLSEALHDLADELPRVRFNPAVIAHYAANEMQSFDYTEMLAAIDHRLLVLGGVKDPVCPIEDSDAIASICGERATYHRVETAGHTVAIDAPDLFVDAVRDYLRSLRTD